MKVGIQIRSRDDNSHQISEINNPHDEEYALYCVYNDQDNREIIESLMCRVGLVNFRDKFLQRMINRFK